MLARLRERDPSWRVVNLSRSGARLGEVAGAQLTQLVELMPVDLVSCAAGVNDLLRPWPTGTTRALTRIAATIPPGSVLATLPRGVRERKAEPLNDAVRALAARYGHRVADLWERTGPPYEGKFSEDRFHPNDRGYEDWAAAFADALGLS